MIKKSSLTSRFYFFCEYITWAALDKVWPPIEGSIADSVLTLSAFASPPGIFAVLYSFLFLKNCQFSLTLYARTGGTYCQIWHDRDDETSLRHYAMFLF